MDLGPPPILTPPQGWLGALGIKSGGKQPQGTSRDLAATLEMAKFYEAGARTKLATVPLNVLLTFSTDTTFLRVPGGKVWLIESITTRQANASLASSNWNYRHALCTDQVGQNCYWMGNIASQAGMIAAAWQYNCADYPHIIALPGDYIGIMWMGSSLGTPGTNQMNMNIFGQEVAA